MRGTGRVCAACIACQHDCKQTVEWAVLSAHAPLSGDCRCRIARSLLLCQCSLSPVMHRCTDEPVGVHFLWAPLYSQHGDRIQRYLAHRPSDRPLVVVAGILYHNVGSTVPPGCARGASFPWLTFVTLIVACSRLCKVRAQAFGPQADFIQTVHGLFTELTGKP